MTPEEIIAKATADLEAAQQRIAEQDTKIAELDAKVNPPQEDPDKAYQPKSWQELDEKVDKKAEAAALKVLQDAEKRKEDERKKQEEDIRKNEEQIEATFKKLEEEGVLAPTKDKNDEGGRQRAQILGALVSLGGQYIDKSVSMAKSAWEQGYELEFNQSDNTVKFVRSGSAPSPYRDIAVGSSANRITTNPNPGAVSTVGLRGDLDEAQRRFEQVHGKA